MEQLDENNSFVNAWPPINEATELHDLPKMIRLTIELADGRKLERLIPGVESSAARLGASASREGGNI